MESPLSRIIPKMSVFEYYTNSELETENLGKAYAECLKPGDTVFLFGSLGAGKTTFVRGIVSYFSNSIVVKSPSYILVSIYDAIIPLCHIDLFRIDRFDHIIAGEIAEYFGDESGIKIVEWAEKVPQEFVPQKVIKIYFEILSIDRRKITIETINESNNSECPAS